MKWFRNLLKGASLTTALFVFEACYGTGVAYDYYEYEFNVRVLSADDLTPLKDIGVSFNNNLDTERNWIMIGYTDENGMFNNRFATVSENTDDLQFRFFSQSGEYEVKDTLITDFSDTIEIHLRKAE